MKKLTETLNNKIQGWVKPLPENLQATVWESLYVTEKAGVFFNERANDFSELFFWHLTPPGSFYWQCVNQLTAYFQKEQKNKERAERIRRQFQPGWHPNPNGRKQPAAA